MARIKINNGTNKLPINRTGRRGIGHNGGTGSQPGGETPPPEIDYTTKNAPIPTGAATATDGSYIDVYFDRAITVDAATYLLFSFYKNGVNTSFTASVIKPDNSKAVRLSVGTVLLNTDVIRVSHTGLLTTPSDEYTEAFYKLTCANVVGQSKPTSYDRFAFIADFSRSGNISVDGSNNIKQITDTSKSAGFAIREVNNTRPTYDSVNKKGIFTSATNIQIWDEMLMVGQFTFAFRINKANTTAQNIMVQTYGAGNLFTGAEGSFYYLRWNGGGLSLNTDFVRTGDELAISTTYNCVIRYNGATMQLYVDGSLYMSKAVTTNDGFNLHQIGPIAADYYWLGVADEALTDTEITELNTYLNSL